MYAALALPLAIPLFLTALRSPEPGSAPVSRASLLGTPPLRYDDLRQPYHPELPEHSLVLTVEKNDTLTELLASGGLSRGESVALSHELAKSIDVRRLRPGQMVRFHFDNLGVVDSVQMKIAGWGHVEALRTGDAFAVQAHPAEMREVETTIFATIDLSLYEALRAQGEGPQLVQQLVDIFQWDIDFFELRKGDSFSLVVRKQFAGEDLVGYAPVAAARFNHRGTTFEAFRHEGGDGHAGYYSAKGAPLRKQFLKAPLQFTRVTSGFTHRRFHPVLKYFRPHYGVDYGAPVGTPVMTTADGVVQEARYKPGEGNFVRIRHSSRYETCYLHLSRFAKGIRRGTRVDQGQVIGYVGKTGLASGPHLDYRVREAGKWINPVKLKSITPDPLRGNALASFRGAVARLQPRLASAAQELADKAAREQALF